MLTHDSLSIGRDMLRHPAGLVRDRRRGREHLWELEIDRFEQARRYLDEISVQWDRALDRLKRFVEEEPGAED